MSEAGLALENLPESTERAPRILLLDSARGLALAAMILFHFTWDLDFFAWLPSGDLGAGFRLIGHAIAAVFLAIVGASLALATRDGFTPKLFFRRLAFVGLSAAAVTIATRLAFPTEYIYFGILHCIFVASLVATPFLFLPASLVLVGAAISLAAPAVLADPAMNAPWIQWLGLGTTEPVTNDWAPFFPAFGFVLAGMAVLRIASSTGLLAYAARWRPRWPAARLPVLAGRHSLAVYLTHQPLLLGLLFLVSFAIGRPPPNEVDGFARSCEMQCMERGSDRPFCTRVCGCIAASVHSAPYWPHVLDDKLTSPERVLFDGAVRECFETMTTAPSPP